MLLLPWILKRAVLRLSEQLQVPALYCMTDASSLYSYCWAEAGSMLLRDARAILTSSLQGWLLDLG